MKDTFRQSMAWLHTWTGLVAGWVLFFVFVTGSTGYFTDEISRWMQPERPAAPRLQDQEPERSLDLALAFLQTHATNAASWTITLPHQALLPRETLPLSVTWENLPSPGQPATQTVHTQLDPVTGEAVTTPEPRATGGGQSLYQMHYLLHYLPQEAGVILVGLCTMLMLLALITGVITHRKFFTDFFTFRPGKGKRSWLDAHNLISVMCLPFFFMITYSGLVFYTFRYMPAPAVALYGAGETQREHFFDELLKRKDRASLPVVIPPAAQLKAHFRQASQAWGTNHVASIVLRHTTGEPPVVELRSAPRDRLSVFDPPVMRFHAVNGSPLPTVESRHAVRETQLTLLNLHEGKFAKGWLRWLYFFSGLMGCAVIATGLIMWTIKRREQQARNTGTPSPGLFGLRLVETLNAGTFTGLPMGVATYFLANRLLPLQMSDRAAWELHALFLTWAWCLLYATLRPIDKAWRDLLWLVAAAYAAVPIVNALTTDRHLGTTLRTGDWVLAGFDLTMVMLAGIFVLVAARVHLKGMPHAQTRDGQSAGPPERPRRACTTRTTA